MHLTEVGLKPGKHNLQLVHTSDDGGYEDKLTGFANFLDRCEKTRMRLMGNLH
jgi:hypothetical protein